MSVGFQSFKSYAQCSICKQSINGEVAVAHKGPYGNDHPWHYECIQDRLETSGKCPSGCNETLSNDALFWCEKKVKELSVGEKELSVEDEETQMQEDLQKMVNVGKTIFVIMGAKYLSNNLWG